MTLISLDGVAKTFGARTILARLDLTITEGARIGVIGPNGGGKSTLLRILAGLEQPDAGAAIRRRGLISAFLTQEVRSDRRTPVQIVTAARPELARIETELEECAERLADPSLAGDLDRMERVLRRQEQLLHRFEQLGGHAFEGRGRGRLMELGLSAADLDRPAVDLSGGQRRLVELAACLAREPDVLLLDEPETHLDAVRRSHLEELIRAFAGAVVMVSHDRYLLDETVSEIAELDRGSVRLWPGNYSAYVTARELALRRQAEQYVTQQKEIARLEEAIQRFRLWAGLVANERHIRQARVKQRQIDRMERVERPVLERRKLGLRLRSEQRGGKRVLELRGAAAGYGGTAVLAGLDLTVLRGERVGIIGANGTGKSLLVGLLAGRLDPIEGTRWAGPSITIGHLAQERDSVVGDETAVDVLRRQRPCTEQEAVQALLRFLFSYEQARQPVGRMSGGERTRLELLVLMRSADNCLVLDEPTNHLDIDAVEVLESAIERYDGTVLFTSHDRYFLDRIADRIVEVRDGRIHCSEGGYSDWYAADPARTLTRGAAR